jgi:hypothetical protein
MGDIANFLKIIYIKLIVFELQKNIVNVIKVQKKDRVKFLQFLRIP